jgi:hypothetical protein
VELKNGYRYYYDLLVVNYWPSRDAKQTPIKLFFPDACWRPDIISGAAFLYFHKDTIWLPLHPASTFLTRTNPFDFFKCAENRAPKWSTSWGKADLERTCHKTNGEYCRLFSLLPEQRIVILTIQL